MIVDVHEPAAIAQALRDRGCAVEVRAIHPGDYVVGPVGVEPRLQGLGIGSRVLGAFCVRMDEEGEIAWLETSKPENVVFYTRAGFRVESESELHGFHTWFMRRDPH